MNTPPPSRYLDPDRIADALARDWALPHVILEYKAVGFGSHHWLAQDTAGDRQWFVSADNLVGRPRLADRLPRALRVAWVLSQDPGMGEVVAPLATQDDRLVVHIHGNQWAVSL